MRRRHKAYPDSVASRVDWTGLKSNASIPAMLESAITIGQVERRHVGYIRDAAVALQQAIEGS